MDCPLTTEYVNSCADFCALLPPRAALNLKSSFATSIAYFSLSRYRLQDHPETINKTPVLFACSSPKNRTATFRTIKSGRNNTARESFGSVWVGLALITGLTDSFITKRSPPCGEKQKVQEGTARIWFILYRDSANILVFLIYYRLQKTCLGKHTQWRIFSLLHFSLRSCLLW